MSSTGAHLLLVCCAGAVLALSRPAGAQQEAPVVPAAAPAPAPAVAADGDPKAAAHAHFDRGLAASNDQRFGEAAVEFEKAYELFPDFRVLYNVGKVRVALGRSAEAVDAFEAYLAKGGDQIPEDRKQEVRDAIATQMSRVATLALHVSPDGAELRIDGKLVGLSPLPAPLRVSEGKHTVEALLPGRPVQLRELELPGASALDVALDFPVAAPPAPVPPPAASPLVAAPVVREAPRRSRALGYAVAGAGVVATAVGAVLAYEAAQDANGARARLVEAATPAMGAPDVGEYDAAKRDFDGAKTRNQLGWALVGFGLAAVVGGGALAFVWSGSSAGVRGSW